MNWWRGRGKASTEKERRYPNSCFVFIRRDTKLAIVAGLFGGGLNQSSPDRIATLEMPTSETLGKLALEKFNAFEEVNLSEHLPKDRPSPKPRDDVFFQASGCKTLKGFQDDFLLYRLKGLNISNLYIGIESIPMSNEIMLVSTVPAHDAFRLGSQTMTIHRKYLEWEQNG